MRFSILNLPTLKLLYVKLRYHFEFFSFKLISNPKKRVLVIGDSHAVFLVNSKLRPIAIKQNYISLWLGPRLLFNINDSDFKITPEILSLNKKSKFSQVIFILGEIDIRCHLAGLPSNWDNAEVWVHNYISWIKKVTLNLQCESITVLCGPPPTDYGLENPNFPKVGPLSKRLLAFNKLNCLLDDASKLFEGVVVKVPWAIIQDPDGSLSQRYTDDGCHINESGSKLIRECLGI